jgi:hypothetical protein
MRSQTTDRVLLAALLVAAAAVAIVAGLLMPTPQTGGGWSQPSTFFNAPHGAKAAYLALDKLGCRVWRLRRPIDTDTLDPLHALVTLRPIFELSRHEQNVLLDWVRAGHTLVVSPPAPPARPEWHELTRGYHSLREWFAFVGVDRGDDEQVTRTSIDADAADDLLAGIHELASQRGRRFDPNEPVAGPLADCDTQPVWADAAGVAAIRVRLGQGTILALADVYPLTNAGLHEADSPLWLANLAREMTHDDPAAIVAFDEYHAGFPYHTASGVAIARLALEEGWGPGMAQVLLVAALALYARGARFGRAHDVVRRLRRSPGEFVTAAGRLLEEAGATEEASRVLTQHYLAAARSTLRLSPNAATPDATLLECLRQRGQNELADLLGMEPGIRRSCRQLLDWCRRIERQLQRIADGT